VHNANTRSLTHATAFAFTDTGINMGLLFSRVIDSLSGSKERRILMLGLDAAGKTTVLYKIKMNEAVHTVPTIGFNVENLRYKNLDMTVWDVGGQDKIRQLWRHYYTGTDALIFVVDSHDAGRLETARDELHRVCSDAGFDDVPVLVLANKADLPGATPPTKVIERMALSELSKRGLCRAWYCQATCAVSGDGIYEGLDWLAKELSARRR
jgi:small GTP-binding protein